MAKETFVSTQATKLEHNEAHGVRITGTTLVLTNLRATSSGKYFCQGANVIGKEMSNPLEIQLNRKYCTVLVLERKNFAFIITYYVASYNAPASHPVRIRTIIGRSCKLNLTKKLGINLLLARETETKSARKSQSRKLSQMGGIITKGWKSYKNNFGVKETIIVMGLT